MTTGRINQVSSLNHPNAAPARGWNSGWPAIALQPLTKVCEKLPKGRLNTTIPNQRIHREQSQNEKLLEAFPHLADRPSKYTLNECSSFHLSVPSGFRHPHKRHRLKRTVAVQANLSTPKHSRADPETAGSSANATLSLLTVRLARSEKRSSSTRGGPYRRIVFQRGPIQITNFPALSLARGGRKLIN